MDHCMNEDQSVQVYQRISQGSTCLLEGGKTCRLLGFPVKGGMSLYIPNMVGNQRNMAGIMKLYTHIWWFQTFFYTFLFSPQFLGR